MLVHLSEESLSQLDTSTLALSKERTGLVLPAPVMMNQRNLPPYAMDKLVGFHFPQNTCQTTATIRDKLIYKVGRGRGLDVYLTTLNVIILGFLFITEGKLC